MRASIFKIKVIYFAIDSPVRQDVLPDLLVINASDLIGDVKAGGSLGCIDDTLVEFEALRYMGDVKSEIKPLNFRKPTSSSSGR